MRLGQRERSSARARSRPTDPSLQRQAACHQNHQRRVLCRETGSSHTLTLDKATSWPLPPPDFVPSVPPARAPWVHLLLAGATGSSHINQPVLAHAGQAPKCCCPIQAWTSPPGLCSEVDPYPPGPGKGRKRPAELRGLRLAVPMHCHRGLHATPLGSPCTATGFPMHCHRGSHIQRRKLGFQTPQTKAQAPAFLWLPVLPDLLPGICCCGCNMDITHPKSHHGPWLQVPTLALCPRVPSPAPPGF